MLILKHKPDNVEDKFAVAVMKSGAVVGMYTKGISTSLVFVARL